MGRRAKGRACGQRRRGAEVAERTGPERRRTRAPGWGYSQPIRFSGADYIEAASERITAARDLYVAHRYVDVLYLAGVAVECVLRAFALERTNEFDARHDLPSLMQVAALNQVMGSKAREDIAVALGEVWARWRNNYRYASDRRIRSDLKRRKLDRGIKGDALKENARIALEYALAIVNKGRFQWNKSFAKH